ncbi:succinylglutamate desuccinylase/aspartoacylase [Spizellomyces punctatus DAOM BR117]|uniref:Succinylglutamate desuccinylase/aspartoacylase n=1 Tax=Spizellomyces punctatus (strain DAOM BR117) TaxID=645134 RepID=A0A0L0H9X2_SPIPD|nr:succinylglutamate desuccinylase/aspartoacylase [Spizellomyces punctatus DAOM BR117]KNC97694.1 succinylglutamate desuccinylase/aspartoacylase [Spizellomyces punctatus DAOM BR117]|eukprot:XP_016605734.1 succinylglutamate desuccinylase/aspartoacylase [Spizellomyces punctatus DAOM BR117]
MPNKGVISPGLKPQHESLSVQTSPSVRPDTLPPMTLSPSMTGNPGQPSIELPKIQVLEEKDYIRMPWKNGLGETHQIAISPPSTDFETEEFVWRLALSEVRDSCSFSVFPGYDIALFLLPDAHPTVAHTRRNSLTNRVALHHNDQATPVPLRPLIPYTYSGEWPTTCRIRSGPIRHLTFIANRDRAHVTANLETICLHGLSDDGECNHHPHGTGHEKKDSNGVGVANPTSKMLLGNFTIVYVVSGGIKVAVEGTLEPQIVLTGQTLICERQDESSPTDFAMTPVASDGTPFEKDEHGPDGKTDHQDATVLIIQVNLLRPERRASIVDVTSPRPRGRAGSIIVFDDQPFQPFSQTSSTNLLHDNSTVGSPFATSPPGDSAINANIPLKHWDSARHYRPPVFSARFKNESDVPPAIVRDRLAIEEFPVGAISTAWINIAKQGLSEWLRIPVIVARGKEDGPVVGITAVVHGNELNGVPCIHRVISDIDVSQLRGTVVAVPCVNVPGYLRYSREFSDGKDLNRLFPGQPEGTSSQIYAFNIMDKVVNHFNFLIDLHTASFGRVNSYYVRSDMNDPMAAAMAKLQQPQIILHNSGQDGALRSAAMNRGVKAITVEIGNPQLFQNQYVQWSYLGVMRILAWLNMFSMDPENTVHGGPPPSTILCSKGFWIYTKTGGVLEVYPNVNTVVRKGDLIARIKNIFGNIVEEIYAPSSGVTIGRSSNPVAMAGDRVLHLGVIKKEGEVLAKEAKENY